ncbi:MAG: squalene/phytoene synthase family protein [Bacteroidetes bacterium]|nr:squalene/phytoene synthase family protein [Bacteroidota bacterium]MBS1930844.1 squalene/phytoene synthase family protein [Bacteroidota bacterium]
MMQLFNKVSEDCSKIVTRNYSTSFSSAIRLLHKDLQAPIYNIYGFVRLADEIVDTFHDHDKSYFLLSYKKETFNAIEQGLSLNPILNSFQKTVNDFKINTDLIHSFFNSMQLDLSKKKYCKNEYEEYIYGSAESVGLMCLTIFCQGDKELFEKLKEPAKALGAAFQKVNFLRDIKADYSDLSRVYFPGCDFVNFTSKEKMEIEEDIAHDFSRAYQGIMQLPVKARFGVYVAYRYYSSLFKKIKRLRPERIFNERIGIPNLNKALIILSAGVKNQLKLI